MKKLFTKILIYAVSLSLLTLAINWCYLCMTEKHRRINVPDDIEICNFGASQSQEGFNYEDFRGKYVCSNFALSSQPFFYDYRVLQHYKHKIKRGAYIFLEVSYSVFFGKPESGTEEGFLSMNKRYYRLLPRELIRFYDWKTDLFVNYLPALSVESAAVFLNLLLHRPATFENFNLPPGEWSRTTNLEESRIDTLRTYHSHVAKNVNKDGSRMRNPEAFDSLYAFIELCREIGARPILVTVPYTRVYTDTIKEKDPKFFGDFYSVIEEVRQKTGVEYYDYAFDERFCDNYNLFLNSDHLNREGARRFTNILLREVLGITP